MSLIIRKYGGSSVSSPEKIISIAKHIKKLYLENHKLIVVVSAMGKSTNNLLDSAHNITVNPNNRELDMLLSIGERKSISLMAIALIDIGVPAVSLTGSQIGLITDNSHGNAQILEIKADRIQNELDQNKVVVVAGYQGVSINKEITTLGRGGTDTTAIALAARFNADRCELMKDVDGLYSVPIDFIHNAYLRKSINFKELQDYSDAGLQLISKNAMKIAFQNKVKLSIGNTYSNTIGTTLNNENSIQSGISQIIEKKCIVSNNQIANEEIDKIISVNGQLKKIYFNPLNRTKISEHIFISIFGFSLLKLPIEELLSNINYIFSNISDEKIELLFEEKNYNIYKNDIFNNIKNYIIK